MIVISLKIPRTMLDDVLRYADRQNISMSEFIRRAISDYILMLKNKELSSENPMKMKIVPIVINYRRKKPKRRRIIRITSNERMIVRQLPPPKLKFLRIVIGGNENGGA